jgi:Leucine-rich repeat (LRR) protein
LSYNYICEVKEFSEETFFSSSNHLPGKSDADVTEIWFDSVELFRLPNIGRKFPNIKKVEFINCSIIEVTSNDLKQFPRLRSLLIKNQTGLSQLTDPQLFQHNPDLGMITLENVGLKLIDHRIFDNFADLFHVNLKDNKCIDGVYDIDYDTMKNLRPDLQRQCEKSSEKCERNVDQTCNCEAHNHEIFRLFKFSCDYSLIKQLKIVSYFKKLMPPFHVRMNGLEDFQAHGFVTMVFPEDFNNLPNLKLLDLSSNFIETLPSNLFEHNPQLEVINLAHNRLKSIGVSTFSHLKLLKNVNLTGNFLCTNFGSFSKEELTMLNTNKIKGACKHFDGLESCDFIEDNFSFVGTAMACITKKMNLTKHEFDVQVHGFDYATSSVEVFFVRKQTCKVLPSIHSIHIKAIHIVNSKFEEMFSYHVKLPNLRSLVLRGNLITHIDSDAFYFLPKLIHIDLRGNLLKVHDFYGRIPISPVDQILPDPNQCGEEFVKENNQEGAIKAFVAKFNDCM